MIIFYAKYLKKVIKRFYGFSPFRLLFIFGTAFLLFSSALRADLSTESSPKPSGVLIVSRYSATHLWSMNLRKELVNVFDSLGANVSIDYVTIDSYVSNEAINDYKFAPYKKLIENNRYSMILVIGDCCIELLTSNASEIPKEIPIVYYGELALGEKLKNVHPNSCGIFSCDKVLQTIRLGIQLMQSTRDAIVIYNDQNLSQYSARRMLEKLKTFKDCEVRTISSSTCDTFNLWKILDSAYEDTLVVFCEWSAYDREGYPSHESLLFELDQHTKNPYMIACGDCFGHGGLGGYASMGPKNVKAFAELVGKIYSGTAAASLPPQKELLEAFIDANVLNTSAIDIDSVPDDVLVINAIPNFFKTYKGEIYFFFSVLVLITILLIIFIITYFRLRKLTRLNMVVFRELPMRIFAVDENGTILFRHLGDDEAKKKLSEYKSIKQFPLDSKILMSMVRRVILRGFPATYSYGDAAGRLRTMTMHKIPDNVFNKKAVIWVSLDKTDAEKSRRNEEKLLRLMHKLLETFPAGIMVKNIAKDNEILFWNSELERQTGIPAREVVGKPQPDTGGLSKSVTKPFDEKAIASGESVEILKDFVNPRTGERKIYKIIKNFCNISDDEKLMIDLGVDITEIEDAKLAAQEADKAKSLFLATITHELRTPLNAVIAFSRLLHSDELDAQTRANYLKSINIAGNVLLNLINDILDFSKLSAKKMTLRLSAVDVPKISDELFAMFKPSADEKKIDLIFNCNASIPLLELDSRRLRQILVNLIGNAVKFTDEGKVSMNVDFSADENSEKGSLVFTISDTGIGISESFRKKIFIPFHQDETSSVTRGNRVYNGTGLGLAISNQLVLQMGGKIDVDSKLGAGSVFKVTLPVKISRGDALETEEEASVKTFQPIAKDKILVVDDVPMNLKVFSAILLKCNAACFYTTRPSEALDIAKKEKIDIVFTDLWMPEINGVELAKKIRANGGGRQIAIYAVTADTQIVDSFDTSVFNGIIRKPISIEDVRKIVQ